MFERLDEGVDRQLAALAVAERQAARAFLAAGQALLAVWDSTAPSGGRVAAGAGSRSTPAQDRRPARGGSSAFGGGWWFSGAGGRERAGAEPRTTAGRAVGQASRRIHSLVATLRPAARPARAAVP